MNMVGALIGGLIAAVVGAAAWAALAYYADFEIGWLAWGIGLLVGLGVAMGSKGGNIQTGVLAAVLSVVSILGGKYAAVHFVVERELAAGAMAEDFDDDEYVISFLADEVVMELEDAGESLNWPPGADRDAPTGVQDYPSEVWSRAEQAWARMSTDEREEFRKATQAEVEANLDEVRGYIVSEGFKASFSAIDLLFFGLALFSAFKLGVSTLGDAGGADASSHHA